MKISQHIPLEVKQEFQEIARKERERAIIEKRKQKEREAEIKRRLDALERQAEIARNMGIPRGAVARVTKEYRRQKTEAVARHEAGETNEAIANAMGITPGEARHLINHHYNYEV